MRMKKLPQRFIWGWTIQNTVSANFSSYLNIDKRYKLRDDNVGRETEWAPVLRRCINPFPNTLSMETVSAICENFGICIVSGFLTNTTVGFVCWFIHDNSVNQVLPIVMVSYIIDPPGWGDIESVQDFPVTSGRPQLLQTWRSHVSICSLYKGINVLKVCRSIVGYRS